MSPQPHLSAQTRNNWLIDAGLLGSASVVAASSLYFLAVPQGGYRGGRNALAGVTFLFDRPTWVDLHTWAGVAMIVVALVHLIIHWPWVVHMIHRTLKEFSGRCGCLNARGRWNLLLNLGVAISFFLAAISGVYFLLAPGGRGSVDPLILFPRSTWDLLHTWSGVALIAAAVVHFAIHWRWVVNVTRKLAQTTGPARQPAAQPGG